MNKKPIIKGFRTAYIDEEVGSTGSPNEAQEVEREAVEISLVALIFDRYAPAETYPESTETKSTLDLIDEMESTCDVSKSKIKLAMEAKGFKLHYTGNEFVWLLKERK